MNGKVPEKSPGREVTAPEAPDGEAYRRNHGYPPDKQEKATRTVLEQAEVLSVGWAA